MYVALMPFFGSVAAMATVIPHVHVAASFQFNLDMN